MSSTAKPVVQEETRTAGEESSERLAVPERSYQRLAEHIIAIIGQGEFKVGERLPSERNLAERFEVSRTAVREAVIALEIQGIVEVRGGSGIYVCRSTDVKPPAYIPTGGPGPFELMRARWLIEAEVAAQAAEQRKDIDLERIYTALVAMREAVDDKRANEQADRLFHIRIAESTGNSVLAQVVTGLWDQLRGPIWAKIEEHFHTPALRTASLQDHQKIFTAVVASDPGAAREAMRRHLERVIVEFSQAWH
jgi:GntR family transcriptional regulator, uxu operon transcriptional repressor